MAGGKTEGFWKKMKNSLWKCEKEKRLMFCKNCGKEIKGNEKFCPHCGQEKPLSEFGYRDMGKGKIRNQSWCKDCR